MPDFLKEVDDLVEQYYLNFEVVWYGHIGDGNLHLNILKPNELSSEEFTEKCKGVSVKIGRLVS